MEERIKNTLKIARVAEIVVNTFCFIVGMVIVWKLTHSWSVMGGAFVASAHFGIEKAVRKHLLPDA